MMIQVTIDPPKRIDIRHFAAAEVEPEKFSFGQV